MKCQLIHVYNLLLQTIILITTLYFCLTMFNNSLSPVPPLPCPSSPSTPSSPSSPSSPLPGLALVSQEGGGEEILHSLLKMCFCGSFVIFIRIQL